MVLPTDSRLPGAVVKVGVPRGPGAVEGERELLVVLVLLTPHPEGGEHFDSARQKEVSVDRDQCVHNEVGAVSGQSGVSTQVLAPDWPPVPNRAAV